MQLVSSYNDASIGCFTVELNLFHLLYHLTVNEVVLLAIRIYIYRKVYNKKGSSVIATFFNDIDKKLLDDTHRSSVVTIDYFHKVTTCRKATS